MPIIPLFGHRALRQRLLRAFERDALPASLLIHGPAGVGKQRLALWLGQAILCQRSDPLPCGECTSCRYAEALQHPDLRWFFPRPRLKDADASSAEVLSDFAEALESRRESGGLYTRPPGNDGIFVSTIRAIVQLGAFTPSLGARKVFVIGDAERMVSQEGSEQAANAFLKLLEEPPRGTTLILTSSEPGALLPTIRSRVVSLRATPLTEDELGAFASHPSVVRQVGDVPAERIRLAAGVPGTLVGWAGREQAVKAARSFLESARGGQQQRVRAILALGGSRARGFFSEMLDALTELLHDDVRTASARGDERRARSAARIIEVVEEAKERAAGNVNPQLLGAAIARALTRDLAATGPSAR